MLLPPYQRFRPHPWHGIPLRPAASAQDDRFNAYIEITPFDSIKYEVDKPTGYLRVDRPQPSNSLPPMLYGFLPQTYCGSRIAALAGTARGDGDPLDICVLSERPVTRADILMSVHVVGGLLMVDAGEADDKIIAVLDRDPLWGAARRLEDIPVALVDRLRHYFMTYKLRIDGAQPVGIEAVYGVERANAVVLAAAEDYQEAYGAAAGE